MTSLQIILRIIIYLLHFFQRKMSSKEEKRAKRLENKKRKIEAFLNVAKLNETDVVKKRKVECTSENFNLLVNSVDNGNVFHSQFMFYYGKTSKF